MMSVVPENQLFNPSFGVGEFPDVALPNPISTELPFGTKETPRATIKPWFGEALGVGEFQIQQPSNPGSCNEK